MSAPAWNSMRVTRRDGTRESVSFDRILRRVTDLCGGLSGVDAVREAPAEAHRDSRAEGEHIELNEKPECP